LAFGLPAASSFARLGKEERRRKKTKKTRTDGITARDGRTDGSEGEGSGRNYGKGDACYGLTFYTK
jgi:hypothetical protein